MLVGSVVQSLGQPISYFYRHRQYWIWINSILIASCIRVLIGTGRLLSRLPSDWFAPFLAVSSAQIQKNIIKNLDPLSLYIGGIFRFIHTSHFSDSLVFLNVVASHSLYFNMDLRRSSNLDTFIDLLNEQSLQRPNTTAVVDQ